MTPAGEVGLIRDLSEGKKIDKKSMYQECHFITENMYLLGTREPLKQKTPTIKEMFPPSCRCWNNFTTVRACVHLSLHVIICVRKLVCIYLHEPKIDGND